MEKLQILYGVQGDGMTFTLHLKDYLSFKERFPDAKPPQSIFVTYDWRSDFANYHAHLEKYIFPALMGFVDETDLKQFKKVEFVKMPEKRVTYTIEQNKKIEQNEQAIQLIPG